MPYPPISGIHPAPPPVPPRVDLVYIGVEEIGYSYWVLNYPLFLYMPTYFGETFAGLIVRDFQGFT